MFQVDGRAFAHVVYCVPSTWTKNLRILEGEEALKRTPVQPIRGPKTSWDEQPNEEANLLGIVEGNSPFIAWDKMVWQEWRTRYLVVVSIGPILTYDKSRPTGPPR